MKNNQEEQKTIFIGTDASGELQTLTTNKGPNIENNVEKEKPIFGGYISYMYHINPETGKKEKLGFKPINYDSVVKMVDELMEDIKMLKAKLEEQQKEIEKLKGSKND